MIEEDDYDDESDNDDESGDEIAAAGQKRARTRIRAVKITLNGTEQLVNEFYEQRKLHKGGVAGGLQGGSVPLELNGQSDDQKSSEKNKRLSGHRLDSRKE